MREPGWGLVMLLAIAYIIYAISVELFKLVIGVGFILTIIAIIIGVIWLVVKFLQYEYRDFKKDRQSWAIVHIIVAVGIFWCVVCQAIFYVWLLTQWHPKALP